MLGVGKLNSKLRTMQMVDETNFNSIQSELDYWKRRWSNVIVELQQKDSELDLIQRQIDRLERELNRATTD